MQNVPHTPSPWRSVTAPSSSGHCRTIRSESGGWIAEVGCDGFANGTSIDKANGDLMAASPELLSSLQNLLQWAQHFAEALNDIEEHDGVPCGVAKDGPFSQDVTKARAAINKALGIADD